jgi:hypothetical protein
MATILGNGVARVNKKWWGWERKLKEEESRKNHFFKRTKDLRPN